MPHLAQLNELASHVVHQEASKVLDVLNTRKKEISDSKNADDKINYHQVVEIIAISAMKVGLKHCVYTVHNSIYYR